MMKLINKRKKTLPFRKKKHIICGKMSYFKKFLQEVCKLSQFFFYMKFVNLDNNYLKYSSQYQYTAKLTIKLGKVFFLLFAFWNSVTYGTPALMFLNILGFTRICCDRGSHNESRDSIGTRHNSISV